MNYFVIPGLSALRRQTIANIDSDAARKIVGHVAKHYGIQALELPVGKRKERSIARQIAMFLVVEMGGKPEVAGAAVSRDRTTAIYAHRKIKSWLSMQTVGGFYAKLQRDIHSIKATL